MIYKIQYNDVGNDNYKIANFAIFLKNQNYVIKEKYYKSLLCSESNFWFFKGYFHREGGPAIIWEDGEKEWWLHGTEYYDEEQYWKELNKLHENNI